MDVENGVEQFLSGVLQAGFPVAVAAFLLLRMERALGELREAIAALRRCQICRWDGAGGRWDGAREGAEAA